MYRFKLVLLGAVLLPHAEANIEEVARECLGYFQLFRYRKGIRFGSYPTAGRYDLDFRQQFSKNRPLTSFYVLHLGEQSRQNWKKRRRPG